MIEQRLAERFQEILDVSPDAILVSDYHSHRFLYVNETLCKLTGYRREELLTMSGSDFTGRSREQMAESFARARALGEVGVTDAPHVSFSRDGERKGWWEPHHRCVEIDGQLVVVTVSREVSARVLAEQAAARSKRIYAALSATNEAIIRSGTPEVLYQQVCEAAIDAGGLTTASILLPEAGTNRLVVAAVAGSGERRMRQAVISIDPSRPEGQGLNGISYRTGKPCITDDYLNDPRTRPWHGMIRQTALRAAASVPILREGKAVGVLYLGASERRAFDDEILALLERMTRNIAFALQTFEHEEERRRAEERAHYLATHDGLTGLPNRTLFGELLDQALGSARRYQQRPAVMFIDLDSFKEVNDSLGHAAGDHLLTVLAERLRSALRDSDVLARLGGDEFVVLLQDVPSDEHAAAVADKLLQAAVEPAEVDGKTCRISASIGISLYPRHGIDQASLMKRADAAMYLAKDRGKNSWALPEKQ